MDFTKSYNERLFEGNSIRSFLHNARFHWFRNKLSSLSLPEVKMIELGCFDGRLLQFCPRPPAIYEGFDAGWEGGLNVARDKFEGHPNWHFSEATEPKHLGHLASSSFNVGAAMETLEHIPPPLLSSYIKELSRLIRGHFLITVPNEKGAIFLAKYTTKLALKSNQKYTSKELINATIGRLDRVERDDHKGFDYSKLIDQVKVHFDIKSVEPLPFGSFPMWTGFTIGIHAVSRN